MEELQDAIEDAQYVNAIATQEDGPRPVLAWDKPNPEALAAWEAKRLGKDPAAFELPKLLESAIGFFLFSSYVQTHHGDYVRTNFCENVVRYKKLRGKTKLELGRRLAERYLSRTEGSKPPSDIRITECDLVRKSTSSGKGILEEANFEQAMDYPTCSESYVGLRGSVREDVCKNWNTQENAERLRKSDSLLIPSAAMEAAQTADLSQEAEGRHEDSVDETGRLESARTSPPRPSSIRTREDSSASASSLNATESMRTLTKMIKTSGSALQDNVFDVAEALVMESLRKDYWQLFLESEEYIKLKNFTWYGDRGIVPDDFFTMRVLGRGGFGLVNACKKGTSGKLYAMKVMSKRRIKMKKSEQLVWNERQALAAVESNFVVNLKYSFHSKDDIYLILDLMTGGDLGYHLHQKGRFPKRESQYYSCRIILALQALHDQKYVYRDLKPENCLLADDGKVKITDLGLATRITPTLHGAAGTRGYWAPEMLRRDKNGKRMNYGHAVDWFSFGCCLAEFISGSNPFRSEAAYNFGLGRGKQTKEKAIDCATLEMDPEFDPDMFEPDAADLCRRLLDKNEKTRLGAGGCEEIMAHPYFKNMNWESIITDRKKPPFIPAKDVNAGSQSEIGNFTEDKALQETVITAEDDKVYKDWDWLNPQAYATEVIEFLIYERDTGEPLLPITQNASCCCTVL